MCFYLNLILAEPNPLLTVSISYCFDFLPPTSLSIPQVALGKGLKARGNVEDWLGKVEEAMFSSLRRLSKAAIGDYQSKARVEWVVAGHPSQVGDPWKSCTVDEYSAHDRTNWRLIRGYSAFSIQETNEMYFDENATHTVSGRCSICSRIVY